jgi:thiamine-monophosphate kinase
VTLDAAAWAEDPELERAARALEVRADELRLAPSDDYELVLAVDPARRAACEAAAEAAQVPLRFVGRVTNARGSLAIRGRDGEVRPVTLRGYDPFRG